MQRLALAALAALPLAAAGALSVTADSTSGVEIGEVIDFTFRQPITGSMGEMSMADFRGKPVLIDFWGTR